MFEIDPTSRTPIYRQVVEQVKAALLRGILEPGDRLPSVRELATTLTLNPNTIQKAYQELEREGLTSTVQGRGTFVSERARCGREPDRGQVADLRDRLRRGIIDAHYLGMSAREIEEMFSDLLREVTVLGRDGSCSG